MSCHAHAPSLQMECTGEQKHEPKVCPRCKTNFVCKVGDVSNCQCSAVKLTVDEQTHLADKYGDCLCCSCMKAEQQGYTIRKFYNKMKRLMRIDS